MDYEVVESRSSAGEWRVEAIDDQTGDCYVTLFSGPKARARAEEYAGWKTFLEECHEAELAAERASHENFADGR